MSMRISRTAAAGIFIASLTALILSAPCMADLLPGQSVGSLAVEKASGGTVDIGKIKKPYVAVFFIPAGKENETQLKKLSGLLAKKEFKSLTGYAITRGLNQDEKTRAKKFLADKKINLQLLYDDKTTTAARRFGVTVFPSFYLVDEKGLLKAPVTNINGQFRKLDFEDFLKYTAGGRDIPFIDLLPIGEATEKSKALVGKPAPDFQLKDLRGKQRSVSEYKGKKNLIVVFWSPVCPHCKHELPLIQQFYLARRFDYNFEVLAVTNATDKQGRGLVDEIVRDSMLTYPVVNDAGGDASKLYGVEYVPAVFFVDKKGIIKEFISGGVEKFSLAYNSIFNDPGRLGEPASVTSKK